MTYFEQYYFVCLLRLLSLISLLLVHVTVIQQDYVCLLRSLDKDELYLEICHVTSFVTGRNSRSLEEVIILTNPTCKVKNNS